MKRLAWILGGAAALACFAQACSSDSASGSDDDDDGASSSGGSRTDASTGRGTSSSSSSGGSSSSSSGSSSGGSSSSGSAPDAGDRCQAASARTEARYTECGVGFVIVDGGSAPECTDTLAEENEHLADCVEAASCGALRGDDDAGADEAAYFACLSGS